MRYRVSIRRFDTGNRLIYIKDLSGKIYIAYHWDFQTREGTHHSGKGFPNYPNTIPSKYFSILKRQMQLWCIELNLK